MKRSIAIGCICLSVAGAAASVLLRPFAPPMPLTVSPVGVVPDPRQASPLPAESVPASIDAFEPVPATPGAVRMPHDWVSTVSASRVRTLIATGDVITARSVNYQAAKRNDYLWPWGNLPGVLAGGDVTLINLETPLTEACSATDSGMVFCGSTRNMEGIRSAGVDVVNVANNHFGNWGYAGIATTAALLRSAGISVSGIGDPAVLDVRGMRFAFLGYNDIGRAPEPIASASAARFTREIGEARGIADVVVVSFHWGTEYTATPSARQIRLAHAAIDAGADLVVGNHPHWVQPAETYRGKWITYAHGNTIFDQMWSEETKKGVIGMYTFIDRTLSDVRLLPVTIADYGRATVGE